jgi:hypothetical protein
MLGEAMVGVATRRLVMALSGKMMAGLYWHHRARP